MLYRRQEMLGAGRWLVLAALLLIAAALISGCGSSLQTVSSAKSNAGSTGNARAETTASDTTQSGSALPETAHSSTHTGKERTAQTRSPKATSARSGQTRSTESGVSAATARKISEPFVEDSRMSGGSGSEADSILGIRYGKHSGYERVVVDLGVGNKPAREVPRWDLLSPSGDGLLRVTLPSVSMTKVSDGSFGSTLLKDYHVVRAPESGMFVDVFVRSGFVYRVIELRDPARLVVDFQATDASLRFPLPAEGGNTVLVEPRRGASTGGPLLVNGYSRNLEGQNTIILRNSSGKVLLRRSVSSNDWTSTWGYFETTLDPPPFSGKATLQVGAKSARDGSFSGVSVRIRGR